MRELPELLTMFDEIYNAIEAPKVLTPSCPILLFEQRPVERVRPTFRGCRRWTPLIPVDTTKSAQSSHEKDFSFAFDVSSFEPEEISVKLVDRDIFVEGKHEERQDEHGLFPGFISRQFTRRITLPKEYDTNTITSLLTKDGKMTIKALRLRPLEPKERIIPIKRIATDEFEEMEVPKKKKELEANEKDEEKTNVEE
jgi:HSP20 family molecular chaperone IbpA